jgi:hypothetical protein
LTKEKDCEKDSWLAKRKSEKIIAEEIFFIKRSINFLGI